MNPMRFLTGTATCFALAVALASARGEDLAAKSSRGKELMAAGRYAEAIPIYKELVRALPNNPGPIMNLGLALHMSGRDREAIREFQEVLRLDPKHLPARLFLGAAYLELKQPTEAIAALKIVVRAQPDNPDALLALGEAYLLKEQFQSAAAQFERLTKLDPQNPKAWHGLGLSYEGLAGRDFVKLEKRALGSPYWLVLFAEARFTAGYLTRAFLCYREAQAKMPTMRGIHPAVAEIYRRIGKPEWAAIEEEKERKMPALDCSEVGGTHLPATARLPAEPAASPPRQARLAARKLECDFWGKRYGQVVAASKSDPTVEAQFWRIRAYNELAREAFSRLAQLPPSAEVHELLATVNFNRRKYHEAAQHWQEALKFSPENRYYQERLAISLSSNHEYEGALKLLEALIQQAPDSLELNYWLGSTILGLREPEKAIPYLTKALEIDPTVPAVHKELARAYMRIGQTEKAIPHLKIALPADEDGSVHYQLSVAYRRLGQRELAAAMLARFQEIEEPARAGRGISGSKYEIAPP
jgi:tetratricopeptide (TPR) repeat protein